MTDRRIAACGACGYQGSIGATGHPISVYWGECMHCHTKSEERLTYHEALIEWNGMNCKAETDTPQPLISKASERIDLPGGWYLYCEYPHYQPNVFSLKEPDGTGRACMFEEQARAFAKAMNDAAELTSRKVVELANRRGKSVATRPTQVKENGDE